MGDKSKNTIESDLLMASDPNYSTRRLLMELVQNWPLRTNLRENGKYSVLTHNSHEDTLSVLAGAKSVQGLLRLRQLEAVMEVLKLLGVEPSQNLIEELEKVQGKALAERWSLTE